MTSSAHKPPVRDSAVPDDQKLSQLSLSVGQALMANGAVCATAESCTGGMVAKLLTDVAGSSAWFEGGVVCYSNQLKSNMLGVPAELIDRDGAVSEGVVLALCQGVIDRTPASIAVAISGVAGPAGGSREKPVGTVWIAWATRDGAASAIEYRFSGNRDEIRRAAAGHALRGILEHNARGGYHHE